MNVDTLLETTVLYFRCKKIQSILLPFSWYKGQIQYISKTHDKNIVKTVFNKLLKKSIITKVKHHKSTYYIFNPYQHRVHIEAGFNVRRKSHKLCFN
jgi:hypothetical protein